MLSQFPDTISAGLTFRADVEANDFPAPDWTVVAILRGPSAIDLEAVGIDGCHIFQETGATTANWLGGTYSVVIRAQKGGDVYQLEAGRADIVADIAALGADHDARSHAEKVLEAIEAVLEKRASQDQQSYTINGRSLSRTPLNELMDLRKTYRAEVRAQKSGGRTKRLLGRKVRVKLPGEF